jgi:hypothetical protein
MFEETKENKTAWESLAIYRHLDQVRLFIESLSQPSDELGKRGLRLAPGKPPKLQKARSTRWLWGQAALT